MRAEEAKQLSERVRPRKVRRTVRKISREIKWSAKRGLKCVHIDYCAYGYSGLTKREQAEVSQTIEKLGYKVHTAFYTGIWVHWS